MILGYHPLFASLLVAVTPLATSIHSICQHLSPWTVSNKVQVTFGIIIMAVSSLLYIQAFYSKSFMLILLSRFIFGFAGSKVV